MGFAPGTANGYGVVRVHENRFQKVTNREFSRQPERVGAQAQRGTQIVAVLESRWLCRSVGTEVRTPKWDFKKELKKERQSMKRFKNYCQIHWFSLDLVKSM